MWAIVCQLLVYANYLDIISFPTIKFIEVLTDSTLVSTWYEPKVILSVLFANRTQVYMELQPGRDDLHGRLL